MSALFQNVPVPHPEQPHAAVVLLLDTSISMDGLPIQALNEGLKLFIEEVSADSLASKRVDLSIITFGSDGITEIRPFGPVSAGERYHLRADLDNGVNAGTPMGAALQKALQEIEARKETYRAEGTDYYRPWLFMITDGEPTDMSPGTTVWNGVTGVLHQAIADKKVAFFAVGVDNANMEVLKALCGQGRQPLKLKGLQFKELFRWLSASQRRLSSTAPGQQTKLEPVDWGYES